MTGRSVVAALAGLTIAAPVLTGAAEVFLGASRTESHRIPIGLAPWQASPETREEAEWGLKTLSADLSRSGAFEPRMVGDAALQSEQEGVRAFVRAELSRRQRDLILEARTDDGQTAQRVVSKRYVGPPAAFRLMVHRLADELVLRYTGEPGVAQTRIVYVSAVRTPDAPERVNYELRIMDADGANDAPLTADRSLNLSPRWSPDGRWLAYTSYAGGRPEIVLMDILTARRTSLAAFPGLNLSPAWAFRGDLLAFAASKDGSTEIYTVDRAGRRFRRLTVDPAEDFSPAWSPNDREIAFVSDRGGSPQIYVMDADGGRLRRLTFEGRYNTSPVWSPTGDWIAYVCRFGRLRLCVIRPDGAEWRQLTEGAWDDESPGWSPDGRHLVFSSTRSGRHEIYRMAMGWTEAERLTANGAENMEPTWSPR